MVRIRSSHCAGVWMTTLGLRTLYHWMTIPWSTYPLFGLFCTPETKLDTTHVATRYIRALFMTELGIEPSLPAMYFQPTGYCSGPSGRRTGFDSQFSHKQYPTIVEYRVGFLRAILFLFTRDLLLHEYVFILSTFLSASGLHTAPESG